MAYFVYILQSERDDSFYVGHTADLRERVKRHNDGRSIYTKKKVPWKLIYQEQFFSRSEASKREREIKGKRNRAYIEHLVRASRAGLGEVVPLNPRDRSRQLEGLPFGAGLRVLRQWC